MGNGYYIIANVVNDNGYVDSLVVTELLSTVEEAREIGGKLTASFKQIMIVQAVECLGNGKTI